MILLTQKSVLLIETLTIIFCIAIWTVFSSNSPPTVKSQFSDQLEGARVTLGSDMTSSGRPVSFLSVDVT
jgi:hypothetical protein